MSERKLASVRRIAEIRPIEGADNIVCAVVDGWTLVTQKANNFKPGDLVIYFEPDSVLPEHPEFEFLRDRCYVSAERSVNGAGFRLRTIRLKGVYSNGLILPLDLFFTSDLDGLRLIGKMNEPIVRFPYGLVEGADLTELLGVVKFERPLPAQLAGVAKGNFPGFLRKTDQERIQNCFKYFQHDWSDHEWEVSIKLDGSSFTAYYRTHPDLAEGQFGVCSRNMELKETEDNAYWKVARKYGLEEKLRSLGRNIAIQGELMGPGIQGNKENLTELDMFVFDIYDINNHTYLGSHERQDITAQLGLKHVPIFSPTIKLTGYSCEDLLKAAEGPSLNAKEREGLVFKSLNDPNISFKAISERWLVKNDE